MSDRDLKLDNTLLSDDEPPLIKLCDFGFARQWEGQGAQMFTHIGYVIFPCTSTLLAPLAMSWDVWIMHLLSCAFSCKNSQLLDAVRVREFLHCAKRCAFQS